MFLELINFLTQIDSGFNVLQYLTLRAILAMLMSLFIMLALGRLFINQLQQYQIAQIIRPV
jgi:phospho-N-acetylmuramoyl-pentapeptide-transferase